MSTDLHSDVAALLDAYVAEQMRPWQDTGFSTAILNNHLRYLNRFSSIGVFQISGTAVTLLDDPSNHMMHPEIHIARSLLLGSPHRSAPRLPRRSGQAHRYLGSGWGSGLQVPEACGSAQPAPAGRRSHRPQLSCGRSAGPPRLRRQGARGDFLRIDHEQRPHHRGCGARLRRAARGRY